MREKFLIEAQCSWPLWGGEAHRESRANTTTFKPLARQIDTPLSGVAILALSEGFLHCYRSPSARFHRVRHPSLKQSAAPQQKTSGACQPPTSR